MTGGQQVQQRVATRGVQGQQQQGLAPRAQAQAPAVQQPFAASMSIASTFGIDAAQFIVLRNIVGQDVLDAEVGLFLLTCREKKLSPFASQIFITIRHDKGKRKPTFVTSIDGYRSIAGRTGELAGIDEPVFVEDADGNPVKATVTVYRLVNGVKEAFTASARWKEFKPDAPNDFMWKKMPFHMLGKCAEAQALRKGFSVEVSGIYVEEEMHQVMRVEPSTTMALNAQLAESQAPTMEAEVAPPAKELTASEELTNARNSFAQIGMTWEQALVGAGIEHQKIGDKVECDPAFVGPDDLERLRGFYATCKAKLEGKK